MEDMDDEEEVNEEYSDGSEAPDEDASDIGTGDNKQPADDANSSSELAKGNPGAVGLYSFFAEHLDPSCGAIIADQQFLADQLGVSRRTIIRWIDYLEEQKALVRIPITGKICAYALDPHEVWKGYNNSKDYAAFVTKTLVNNDGEIRRRIMSMFSMEERE